MHVFPPVFSPERSRRGSAWRNLFPLRKRCLDFARHDGKNNVRARFARPNKKGQGQALPLQITIKKTKIMKKTFIYILLLVFAMSCSKDEPTPPPPQPNGPNATLIENMQNAIQKAANGTPVIVNDGANLSMTMGGTDNAELVELLKSAAAINKQFGRQVIRLNLETIDKQGNGRANLPNGFVNLTMNSKSVEFAGENYGALPTFSSTEYTLDDTVRISNFLTFLEHAQGVGGNQRFRVSVVLIDAHYGYFGDINNFDVFSVLETGEIVVSKYNLLSSDQLSGMGTMSEFLHQVASSGGSIKFVQDDGAKLEIGNFGDREAKLFSTPGNPRNNAKFNASIPPNPGSRMAMSETGTSFGVYHLGNGVFEYGPESTVPFFQEVRHAHGNKLVSIIPYGADTIGNLAKHGVYPVILPEYQAGVNDAMFYKRANGEYVAHVAYNGDLHGHLFDLRNLMVNFKYTPNQVWAVMVPVAWPILDSRNIGATPTMTWRQYLDFKYIDTSLVVVLLNPDMPVPVQTHEGRKLAVERAQQQPKQQEAILEKRYYKEL